MSEEELHQWMIESFGPEQGEMAWQQLSSLPPEIREQLMSAPGGLPDPQEVHSLMDAFTTSGLSTMQDIDSMLDQGPINIKLASSIAHKMAQQNQKISSISAISGQQVRSAVSQANLWLDSIMEFNPPAGTVDVLTRDEWVSQALPRWAHFAAPVAKSMNQAMASVFSERLGGMMGGEITGMFAGPIPMPIPDDLKDPQKLMTILGNTTYAMQLGRAGGQLSSKILGGFDQGIALLPNPAGAMIPENIENYAQELNLSYTEVLEYLSLVEQAHARLFASVSWLMPQFDALIGKYARGITIDLDAMEEQLRQAEEMNPDSLAGAVDLSKVGMSDTPEQREALHSLENLMALVEGWVDTIVWRAGMAHIPHLNQLREMQRRERALGGPAEETFETLLGLQLKPKKMREAAELWETITLAEGQEGRDGRWSHPDLLPTLPEDALAAASAKDNQEARQLDQDLSQLLQSSSASSTSSAPSVSSASSAPPAASSTASAASTAEESVSGDEAKIDHQGSADMSAEDNNPAGSKHEPKISGGIDWDAELDKLLASEGKSAADAADAIDAADDDSEAKKQNDSQKQNNQANNESGSDGQKSSDDDAENNENHEGDDDSQSQQ